MTNPSDMTACLERIGHPRILVLGDLILDRYTWGNAERISPEAPVIVLQADLREVRPGGAASVAYLLNQLGAEVHLVGVVGKDPDGHTLQQVLEEAAVPSTHIVTDSSRPTTTKERFIGRASQRHPHQILRVDHEVCRALDEQLCRKLEQEITALLDDCQAVLISDYGKGVCCGNLLRPIIHAAQRRSIPVIIDPARSGDYSAYAGASLITPNRNEAETATLRQVKSSTEALLAAKELVETYQLQAAVVTLDREGMVLVTADGDCREFSTKPRQTYDITGAGDMVLAMFGLCLAERVSLPVTAQLANLAAGLQVERMGVSPVTRAEIAMEARVSSRRSRYNVLTEAELAQFVDTERRAGRSIVFTNGCFDLLHLGHIEYLKQAAALGDLLIVAINSDRSLRRLKGASRPIIDESARAALLGSLSCVDAVVVFDDDAPERLLRRLQPDVLVKGGTYAPDEVVGREIVEGYGGVVHITDQIAGVSTTEILASIRRMR